MTDEPVDESERTAEPTAAAAVQANQPMPLSSEQRLRLAIAGITVAGTVMVAIVGIAGPLMQYVADRSKQEAEDKRLKQQISLEELKQKHSVDMDFLAKLIDAERIPSEESRTYFRRDVLRFFSATLENGALKKLAVSELIKAETRGREFESLRNENRILNAELEAERRKSSRVTAGAPQAVEIRKRVAELEEKVASTQQKLLLANRPTTRFYQGARVACDRASRKTAERLSAADQASANSLCRGLALVSHQGSEEPSMWSDGTGLTFNTGRRIADQAIWCSCAFES